MKTITLQLYPLLAKAPLPPKKQVIRLLSLIFTTLGVNFAAAAQPRKLIVDCDPGIDDAMAIIIAMQTREFDLLGITTTFGNATVDQATSNALRIVELSGKNVPVYRGSSVPLSVPLRPPPDFVQGKDGLGNTSQPAPLLRPQEKTAAQFLVDAARAYPGQITLLAIGPLSNLGHALRVDPRFASNIREVVLMGGALYVPGNVTPIAEANIYGDPDAADLVFTAPWRVTMIGLDVTTKVKLKDRMLARIKRGNSRFGPFIWSITRFYAEFHRKEHITGGIFPHDPSAVVYLTNSEICETRQGPVRVVCDGIAIGPTIMAAYDYQFQLPPWNGKPLVTATVNVNEKQFLRTIERLMAHE